MSNNKQSMKLYTEEEVIRAIELSDSRSTDEILAGLTPIQLPSNEEIDIMWPLYYTEFGNGLNEGAKQMRDKIQGGNK